MRTQQVNNLCRPSTSGKPLLIVPLALLVAGQSARGQAFPDGPAARRAAGLPADARIQPGANTPPADPPSETQAPSAGGQSPGGAAAQPAQAAPPGQPLAPTAGQAPQSGAPRPSEVGPQAAGPPPSPDITISADKRSFVNPNGDFVLDENVVVKVQNTTISADHAEGNLRREIVLSGNARIETQGATAYADSIHVFPASRSFRLINPRGVLLPEFIREQVTEPVYLSGANAAGTTTGYFYAQEFIATTCREHFHHYEFRIGDGELFPGEKLVLHR